MSSINTTSTSSQNGTTYRAKGGFPKLWIECNDDDFILFSPRASVVFESRECPLRNRRESPLEKSATVKSNKWSKEISWKEEGNNCTLLIGNKKSYKMYLSESMEAKEFGYRSPLVNGKELATVDGTYSSTGFSERFGGVEALIPALLNTALGGLGGLFGGANVEETNFGGFDVESLATGVITGIINNALPALFGASPGIYGKVGFYKTQDFASSGSGAMLPTTTLQSRGQLYPMLQRIKLENAKLSGREVWQFSTAARESIYLDIAEERLDKERLLEDRPHTWYLLENTENVDEDPYVVGVGAKTVRVHMPGEAISLNILKTSELFDTEHLKKPIKEMAKRAKGSKAMKHFSSEKLKQTVEELAYKVSYKTIRTMMRRASPNGADPSMKIKVLSESGVRELHLVLYAVHTKFIRFLGKIGGERITHLVTAWTDTGEIMAAYWASAPYWTSKLESKLSLDDAAYRVMYDVYTTMQKGGEIPESLIEARLDTKAPTNKFSYVPGEYGAAVREATSHEYNRYRKASHDEAFGSSFLSALKDIGEAAAIDVANGVVSAGKDALINTLFGYNLDSELHGEEEDLEEEFVFGASGTTEEQMQPYTKIKCVYDQQPYEICVLCSIAASMQMIKNLPGKEALDEVKYMIPWNSVPRGGLNMANTFEKLEDVFSKYQLTYKRISPTVLNIKKALDSGFPVMVGTIFDEKIFHYQKNLNIPLSGPQGGSLRHCVTIVAYDDADSTFTVLNSWSSSWGRNGAMIVGQDYSGFQVAYVLYNDKIISEDSSSSGVGRPTLIPIYQNLSRTSIIIDRNNDDDDNESNSGINSYGATDISANLPSCTLTNSILSSNSAKCEIRSRLESKKDLMNNRRDNIQKLLKNIRERKNILQFGSQVDSRDADTINVDKSVVCSIRKKEKRDYECEKREIYDLLKQSKRRLMEV